MGRFKVRWRARACFEERGCALRLGSKNAPQVVPDVNAFPGHVACSSASLSEVVLPVRNGAGRVVAVWDIDSADADDFAPEDVAALEELTAVVSSMWDSWTWRG